MTMASRKTILAVAGAALLVGACASDPYYNGSGYYGDQYSYGYGGGPAYYDPYYTGPTVGFGLAWNDRDGNRWRDRDHSRDRDRDRDHDWRNGDRGDFGGGHEGRDGSGSTGQNERG
jgi:hypothetical protein